MADIIIARPQTDEPRHETQQDKLRRRSALPPGWDYNPSAWNCRGPIIVMAVIDVLLAGYLALYQYGAFSSVWEPFFGEGSAVVLDSWLSRILPVSDATLGVLAYLADVVTGVIGKEDRWRSKPWVVILFAIFVGPVGLVSVGLVIAQPVLFDAWCTLCLVSAALSVAMIGPAMDEVLACLQYLKRVKARRDGTFWRAFWGTSDVGAHY